MRKLPAADMLAAGAIVALLAAGSARAEEVWLQPRPFSPDPGTTVELSLQAGEHFNGSVRRFSLASTAALQLYSKLAVRDLRELLSPEQDVDVLRLTPAYPGTHMMVYDDQPQLLERDAAEFGAWLREQGMEQVQAQRGHTASGAAPVRERLRHHAKTLLRVGGRSDGTHGLLTGQRLEIVPSADPLARRPGDTLTFSVTFDSKPVDAVLVQAWHRGAKQTFNIRARTSADGKVALTLPWPGTWLIGAVHMMPAVEADADWDSYRASLSFELPSP